MKPAPRFLRTLASVLILTGGWLAQATGADPAPPTVTSNRGQPALVPTGLVSKVYLALVRDSLVPADPGAVATAALAGLPAEHRGPLPDGLGADAARDAAWLEERTAGWPLPWPVVEAMARAAKIAHTALLTPQRQPCMRALGSGRPLSVPGFRFHPLADGRLVISDVIPGASADVAGLRAGDVLNRLADRAPVRGDSLWINTLPAGTEVKLEVERDRRALSLLMTLQPAEVPSVVSSLSDDGIGYVRIRSFARTSEADRDGATLVRSALAAFVAQGARGLIIDLRSALGGSGEVGMASAICDGEVIYSIQQPMTTPARPVPRNGVRIWPDRPVVVLINEITVSAGEALALSLRELGHATIIGRTTGGGLTEFARQPLGEGYVLITPTGVVLGPVSGRVQPGHAIKPDLEVPNPDVAELLAGRDRQLEAARAVFSR
jgi:C-terminal processing protease CtpA/Prc